MKRILFGLIALHLVCVALAQPGGPQASGINASLLKFFGNVKAFSAQGEIRLSDAAGKEISIMPITMALRDGKLRSEMDMSRMKGAEVPPEAVAMLRQTGLDRVQMLMMPQNKSTVMIYPGLRAYASVPISDDDLEVSRIETIEEGTETVDGHPCVKRKLVATDGKGGKQEALVWAARDLKGFPIQMQMKQRENSIQIRFKDPLLGLPDAKLFEIPADYAKHESLQSLMQVAMMKMFENRQ